jgi:hypothetical protein
VKLLNLHGRLIEYLTRLYFEKWFDEIFYKKKYPDLHQGILRRTPDYQLHKPFSAKKTVPFAVKKPGLSSIAWADR